MARNPKSHNGNSRPPGSPGNEEIGDELIGTVKRLVPDRGFGFIRHANGKEYFFHTSGCREGVFDTLQEGQSVAFSETQSAKGPRAQGVEPI